MREPKPTGTVFLASGAGKRNQGMQTLEAGEATFNPKPVLKPGFLRRIFRFFSSVKLAVTILVTLMAVLATGTIIESLHGTDAARLVVYQSWWFSLILLVLAVNLLTAALSRMPWKVKHTGFVITHLGIILILTGSWLTAQTVVDGQIAIEEGQSEHRITLSDPLLYAMDPASQEEFTVFLKQHPFPWEGKERVAWPAGRLGEKLAGFGILLAADYPKARMEESVIASDQGPAAVKVRLKSSFVDQTQWLVDKDAAYGEVALGPARLKFSDTLLKESPGGEAASSPYLEFAFKDNTLHLPIPENLALPAVLDLPGTEYKIEIVRVYKSASVVGKELIENPETSKAAANPAVQFILRGKNFEERHSVFANFPDFPTVHGLKPSLAGARVFYRIPGAGSRGETHELRFVSGEAGKIIYQIQDGLEIKTGVVEKGKKVSLGWMDMRFTAEEVLEHARVKREFRPEPNTSESEEAVPAIALGYEREGRLEKLWLRQGVQESLEIGGNKILFVYGQKRIPAGFKLALKDFRMEKYPGTDRPASFESDVVLKDDSRGVVIPATVSMNKPLVYHGFRIYQSGYSLPESGPEVSIFSVGKDPGVPLKYLGAIVMVIGVSTMFYTRKFSSTAGRMVGR